MSGDKMTNDTDELTKYTYWIDHPATSKEGMERLIKRASAFQDRPINNIPVSSEDLEKIIETIRVLEDKTV
jgi:hypothetical protein